MYYYGARYYDPVIGRFTTRDPKKGDLMNPQSLNPYVYCVNNPMKYIDPDGNNPRDYIANVDSLYLTWQDMWDASHSDWGNDHWDPDKPPPVREHKKEEITDFPINSVGIELSGSFVEVLGVSGSVTFVIDEHLDFKVIVTEQIGEGIEAPGGSVRLVFSSMRSEELLNTQDMVAAEVSCPTPYLLGGSAQWSGKPGGPPQTLHIGISISYPPKGGGGIRYRYIRSYLLYD